MRKLQLRALLGVAAALLLLGACGSELDGAEEPALGTETQALSGPSRHAVDYWRAFFATPSWAHPATRSDRCTLAVPSSFPYQILLGGVVAVADDHLPALVGRSTRYCPLDERPVLFPIVTMEADGRLLPTTARPRLAEMARHVSRFVDGLGEFEVLLDGRPIALPLVQRSGPQAFSYRLEPFPLLLPRLRPALVTPAVADGVFAYLPTLPPGDHRLEIRVRMIEPPSETYALYAVRK